LTGLAAIKNGKRRAFVPFSLTNGVSASLAHEQSTTAIPPFSIIALKISSEVKRTFNEEAE
jgi:hypothetical protein